MKLKQRKEGKLNENYERTKRATAGKLQKGITLIALVITIIVLLILAGVSIATLTGDNGILTKAQKAADLTEEASDKEFLEQLILSMQIDNYSGNVQSKKIGKELHKKSVNHSYDWHIIKVNDKRYEDGWYLIEEGEELADYGKAKNRWLVNYETGEIIQLEEGEYTELKAGDMLAVKEDLIINVDSSLIDSGEGTDKNSVQEQLGENVELVGFGDQGNEESGLTETSFNFDGEDDYIKVAYNDTTKRDKMIEDGFTFEFYGDATVGKMFHNNSEDTTQKGIGGFGWGSEDLTKARNLHFRFSRSNSMLSIQWGSGRYASLEENKNVIEKDAERTFGNLWHIGPEIGGTDMHGLNSYAEVNLNGSTEFYITVTLNPNIKSECNGESVSRQTLYLNGKMIAEGWYYDDTWNLLKKNKENLQCFTINRTSQNTDNYWEFGKMKAYCFRLYNRSLTNEEVFKNYDKSVSYHLEQ